MINTNVTLPARILELAELYPFEEIGKYVIEWGLEGAIPVYTLIPEHVEDEAFILVRRNPAFALWGGDTRFVDEGQIVVTVFCRDPDGDEKGAIISEAIRVIWREAFKANLEIPDKGWISRVRLFDEPSRKTDWANSAGPVQYADLPSGFWRYESTYQVSVRRKI